MWWPSASKIKNREIEVEQTSREKYFDVLNILACFAVIMLHHNDLVHHWQNSADWLQALAVEVLFFWPVPIFLMLSGATLFDYRQRYDTITFFKKRCKKVLVPYLFWSAALLYLTGIKFTPIEFINGVVGHKVECTYYFFPLILSLYMLIPLISLVLKRRDILWYTAAMIFVIDFVICFWVKYIGIDSIINFEFPMNGMFLYMILGYLFATQKIGKKWRYTIYAGAILSIALRYGLIYYLSARYEATDKYWMSYKSLFAALPAGAIFLWFKQMRDRLNFNAEVLKQMATCSLGIYLLHKPLMAWEKELLGMAPEDFMWRIILPFVTYLICLNMVFWLRKIPLVRHVLP